ncbi:MAG TPA: ABC-F family ATP-binding cassette domain-containing protein [Anaerolineales bacterium]|nr:ABC-F family ATP-binding cassette domain-containing protein [Anaerolineales bacterium]
MSLISAADLAKSYGAQDVFEGVSLALPHQARIALVGPNGIGKTTLLRLLAGLESPDHGLIQRARNLRIGYLPQEATAVASLKEELERTLWESCQEAFRQLREQEAELARLEAVMSQPGKLAAEAMSRYGTIQEAFERAGGYVYPSRIRQVLSGLGFTPDEHDRPLSQFSGGERTRAFLARLLLEDPDLLILDEPTNHLDMQAVEWLESWLRDWPGAVLIVSHDRYFLDRTVEALWELSAKGLDTYRGNYSAYALQRVERRARELTVYLERQEHIQREEQYIQRNIAGQNTRQAQGRRKRLQRMLKTDAVVRPQEESAVSIDFRASRRGGDLVLETQRLVIGHVATRQALFEVPDLALRRGECVALIGPNGAGKTTFLKTILGEAPPLAGEVRLGASLEVGYFAQAHERLDARKSVLEELLGAATDLRPSQARHLLARYLFLGDDVEKMVAALSGGERGRLALAKLALQGANLLLLDEPTNHLDIPSQEMLQEALDGFPGTILLVSHDRYLIDALATQVWAISPEARRMTVHSGGYAAYVEWRRSEAEKPRQRPRPAPQRERSGKTTGGGTLRAEAELAALERRIAELEAHLTRIGDELGIAGSDVSRVALLGAQYATVQEELDGQLLAWEQLAALAAEDG